MKKIFTIILCSIVMSFCLINLNKNIVNAEENYLTFTADHDSGTSSIAFNWKSGSGVQYSTKSNSGVWTEFYDYSKETTVSLSGKGDAVRFKGTSVITNDSGHFSMSGRILGSGDVTSLTNGTGGDVALAANNYSYMFYNCSSLITAPNLPSTTLANQCYSYMFKNCTSLTTAPNLPATNLYDHCYYEMFKDCTSLTTAPNLPATTLVLGCYSDMFYGCTSLVSPPIISATTLAQYCCYQMFKGCTSLIVSTSGEEGEKFFTCPSTAGITNPVTYMFNGVYVLSAGEPTAGTTYYSSKNYPNSLTFTALEDNSSVKLKWFGGTGGYDKTKVYISFDGNSWDNYGTYKSYAFEGPIINLNKGEKVSFIGYKVKTEMSTGEYFSMSGQISASGDVTSLTNLKGGDVNLSNTYNSGNYDDSCYIAMFKDCTALYDISGLQLPSTILDEKCYEYMFEGCTNLASAPKNLLPSTSGLKNMCYQYMFKDCASLKAVPDLPATTLADACYAYMYQNCSGLREVPSDYLPSTSLKLSCYTNMFNGCTCLMTIPKLPATTLINQCYKEMFKGCSLIRLTTTQNNIPPFKITATSQVNNQTDDMFKNTGGTFKGTPALNTNYYFENVLYYATTSSVSSVQYDGTAKKPSITVKYLGNTLTEGTDYTLEYKNNTNVGTATIVIKPGSNNVYYGDKEVTFTISSTSSNSNPGASNSNTNTNTNSDVGNSTAKLTGYSIVNTSAILPKNN